MEFYLKSTDTLVAFQRITLAAANMHDPAAAFIFQPVNRPASRRRLNRPP
jgi:hypothetical protein